MKKNGIIARSTAVLAAFALAGALVSVKPAVWASAEETDDVQYIYTDYADLWKSDDITAEAGKPVKWYVVVPEDVTPKGCGSTIKIPGLGFGTDTRDKTEGHIVLTQGENFIYEFTPEEEGDILFTCWMGSGCHKNYIHITAPAPAPQPEESSEADESSAPEDSSQAEESSAPDESSSPDAVTPADDNSSAEDSSSVTDSSDTDSSSASSSSSSSSSKSDNGGNNGGKSGGSTGNVDAPLVEKEGNPTTGTAAGSALAAIALLGGAAVVAGRKGRR